MVLIRTYKEKVFPYETPRPLRAWNHQIYGMYLETSVVGFRYEVN